MRSFLSIGAMSPTRSIAKLIVSFFEKTGIPPLIGAFSLVLTFFILGYGVNPMKWIRERRWTEIRFITAVFVLLMLLIVLIINPSD